MYICVTDTDAKTYKGLSLRAVIEAAARVEKAKYLKACLDQQFTFASMANLITALMASRDTPSRSAFLLSWW